MMESRNHSLRSIVWAVNQFVATGRDLSGQGIALTSPDGILWTRRNIATAREIYHTLWTGTLFVSVDSAGMGFTSQEGVTWIENKIVEPWFKITGIVWTGSQIVAMGTHREYSVIGIVSTSPDGKNWTSQAENRIGSYDSYTWTGQQIVGVAADSSISSPDGIIWTTKSSNLDAYIHSVVSSGTQIAGLSLDGRSIYTSQDGLKWTSRSITLHPEDSYKYLTRIRNQFFVFSSFGVISSSPDGTAWAIVEAPEIPPHLYSVISSGSDYIAVGERGVVMTSTDGITWSAGASGTKNSLRSITWAGSQFIAVGDSGTILSSTNARTWTQRASGIVTSLRSITRTGTHFVAVGAAGTVLTSPDGNTWTPRNSGTASSLNSIAWSGSQLVAVGDSGAKTCPNFY